MKRIDLHTHSTASDGSCTPTEVMEAAVNAGLAAVALTDHDTMQGVPEAMEAAEKLDIECIPGIELSAVYGDREVHIVGLFLDPRDSVLAKRLDSFRQIRKQRNLRMIEKCRPPVWIITMEKVRDLEGDAVNHPGPTLPATSFMSAMPFPLKKSLINTCLQACPFMYRKPA